MIKEISSINNSLIKKIIQLQDKSRERRKTGLFVIEGRREIDLAIKGGYEIKILLYNPEIISADLMNSMKKSDDTEIISITEEVYQKIAYRDTTEGIIAISKTKELNLEQLELRTPDPLILVAEAPEKPGNIGALLRTADAAGIDAVLIADPMTDLYNPNIIRSSVGCIFTISISIGSSEDIINYLKKNQITIYCAALQASKSYTDCDFNKGVAIVVGTESTGVSDIWIEKSNWIIKIPMHGEIDSMNVSVAAGIIIFEAKRQRKKNNK
jgi:TrmH family RNA methyltransferase